MDPGEPSSDIPLWLVLALVAVLIAGSGVAAFALLSGDKDDKDDLDKEEIEQFTGLMRALGLITGDVDLFDAVNDVSGSGTLAYYSPEDERVTIRGLKLTPAARASLVHELTHALQDQHFKIGDRSEKLRKESEDGASTTEYTVFDLGCWVPQRPTSWPMAPPRACLVRHVAREKGLMAAWTFPASSSFADGRPPPSPAKSDPASRMLGDVRSSA